jgi:putative redox protein
MTTRIRATVDPAAGRVEASTGSGQPIHMDADPPHGEDSAASPMETLLAALAACTAIDVISILRKKRQEARSYDIAVEGETADEFPKVFTSIVVEHRVVGAVEPEALRRSIELSVTQYCPVNAMLATAVPIQHRYHLVDAGGATHEAVVAVRGPGENLPPD